LVSTFNPLSVNVETSFVADVQLFCWDSLLRI